ncbi:hypothetical protein HKD37_20G055884 [Glycine soja]
MNFDERALLVQNVLSSQKEMRDSKRTSLSNALSKETLGQTLANPLRVSPWTSIVISFSSRENSSLFLLIERD